MAANRKPTRYAHADGHADVCYAQNGEKLISCGSDGDIRIWSGFDDDDPVQSCVGEISLCVLHNEKYVYVSTDNIVQIVTFPDGERDSLLTRFTAPVNHMAVAKDKELIALVSEDMTVMIMNMSTKKQEKSFFGLTGPPLSVAICPKSKLIAVSSGDGFLRMWDVESEKLLKKLDCVPKVNSFMNATVLCRMDFDPNVGHYLAYPENNKVVVLNTSDWSKKYELSCEAVEDAYSIVQFSPCGNFIAAASIKGDIAVWEVITQILVDATIHSKSLAICAMVWNPSGNGEIAFCDVEGQLGIVTNCISMQMEAAKEDKPLEDEFADENIAEFDDDNNDEDNENAVSLEKLKRDIMGDVLEADDDAISSHSPSPRPRTPDIPLQAPFMPSSTPEHLDPRYLCWNNVGVVRCYGSSLEEDAVTEKSSIEVEFHDSSFHSSMMMGNYQGYTMGSLSMGSLVVASSSQLTVVPLSASSKEWNLSVEEGAEIVCVASSSNLVCFATSNYLVRVCTVYGTQKSVFSVPGPLVSMTAFGNFLLVAYHSAPTRKGDQCINLILVTLEGFSVDSKDLSSALRPESTLQWMGFSDVGTPVMMDSTGLVSFYPLTSNIWLPFCDTSKHSKSPTDGFFVTAVDESLAVVLGIQCRGSMYPGFTPRPTQIELPLQPSFVELTNEKTALEANMFTWSTLQVENTEKKLKESALKTFALACRNSLDERALELIEMVGNPQVLALAVKYASKLDKRRLAEKLADLAGKLQDDEGNTSSVSAHNISISTPTVRRVDRKLVLNYKSKSAPKNRNPDHKEATPRSNSKADTPSNDSVETPNTSDITNAPINTQESVFSQERPKNPFATSLKKSKASAYNPLCLTDKFAGMNQKENKTQNEKRKEPDSLSDLGKSEKQKEKQRKLNTFMFSKKS